MNTLKIEYLNSSESFKNELNSFLDEWFSMSNSIFTKTSGSTGNPKIIELSKSKMRESARMTGDFLKLQKGANALLCLPISTIAGKMMVVRAIELEMNLIATLPTSNPLENCDFQIDFAAFVPIQLSTILEKSPLKLKSIQTSIIGGGIISKEIESKLIQEKLTVFQTFGMTETISHVAMRKVGFESQLHYSALSETTFAEIDNQLIIKSPLLDFQPLKTNDIVELKNEKEFIWKGRADFIINTGGIKVQPEEIEKKISKLIPNSYFISSLEDALLGQKIILCIEGQLSFELSKSTFESTLTRFEIPKEIYFFKHFEYTESNKISRLKTLETNLKNALQQVL